MRDEIDQSLMRAIGRGAGGVLDVYAYAQKQSKKSIIGAGVKYEHAIRKDVAAYVRGEVRRAGGQSIAEAVGGLRMRF